MNPACAQLAVLRFGSDGVSTSSDSVAVEAPLEILVGERHLAMTMRTPGHDEELAAGFLFTEGLVQHRNQIRSLTGAGNRVVVETAAPLPVLPARQFTMTSACGVCGKTSVEDLFSSGKQPIPQDVFTIHSDTLRTLPEVLRQSQTGFHQTGGLHAAGLFDAQGRAILVREDVGRHNAVDKLIGSLFLTGLLPAQKHILLVSSRASFELVQKSGIAGIPMLAAIGAPSTLAVETAQRFGITLAGFLREDRFNVYAGEHRIVHS